MNDRDPRSYTFADLSNPSIDLATLGHIASTRPDLWQAVAQHPNATPELRQWIQQAAGVAPAAPSVPQAPAAPPVPQAPWGAGPQQYPGSQQYPAQQVPQPAAFGAAAPSGYGGYPHPGASEAKKAAAVRARPRLYVLIGLAILGIVSLFLPVVVASFGSSSMSVSYFDSGARVDAIVMLTLLILTALAAGLAIIVPGTATRVIAGVAAIIAGLLTLTNGLLTIIRSTADEQGGVDVSFGPGAVALVVIGLALVAVAIWAFVPPKSRA